MRSRSPQVRLDRWRFALAAVGRVAIHGCPLPPLPGSLGRGARHRRAGRLDVDARSLGHIVRDMFGLPAGDIALWHEGGSGNMFSERFC